MKKIFSNLTSFNTTLKPSDLITLADNQIVKLVVFTVLAAIAIYMASFFSENILFPF